MPRVHFHKSNECSSVTSKCHSFSSFFFFVFPVPLSRQALRLYPPVTIVPKLAAEDVSLSGGQYIIPKGSVMHLNIYALHRNPKHYKYHEAFKPTRWDTSREDHDPIDHFAFAAFR